MRVGDDPFFIITSDHISSYRHEMKRGFNVPVLKSQYKLSEVTRVSCVRGYYGDELRLYHYENVLAIGCPCASDDVERVKKEINEYRKRNGLKEI